MKTLTVIVGPVHSEKSTHAIRIALRHRRLRKRVVLIRPTKSVRAHERPGFLVTKNGLDYPSHEVETSRGIEPVAVAQRANIVWIDEPMLFPDEPNVFHVLQQVRRSMGVLVSGLVSTSELEPFGTSMPSLLAVADSIIRLRADCDLCGRYNAATRSLCLRPKSGQVLVGGEEVYRAACPKCWTRHTAQTVATQDVADSKIGL